MKVHPLPDRVKDRVRGYTQVELKAEIHRRAYALYEQRGKADGHALDDWLRAEAEVLEPKQKAAA